MFFDLSWRKVCLYVNFFVSRPGRKRIKSCVQNEDRSLCMGSYKLSQLMHTFTLLKIAKKWWFFDLSVLWKRWKLMIFRLILAKILIENLKNRWKMHHLPVWKWVRHAFFLYELLQKLPYKFDQRLGASNFVDFQWICSEKYDNKLLSIITFLYQFGLSWDLVHLPNSGNWTTFTFIVLQVAL